MKKDKIKLYLLTGFLGAGKTTLLQNLLEMLSDKKAGIIVNEFGKLGVDGAVIKRDGLELIEINNGSIFCSCLEGSFIEKVVAFSKLPIDYLFVEASGLSDPSNMESILNQVQRITNEAFEFKGSMGVVDAKNFSKLYKSLNTFQRQINYSNLIIINKIDLVPQQQVDEIVQKIQEVNPMAGIIKTSYCKLEQDILDTDFSSFRFPGPKTSNNCPTNRPEIFILKTDKKITKKQVLDYSRAIAEDTYRIKGFVHLEESLYHLDCVENEVEIRQSKLSRDTSEIVVISKGSSNIKTILEQKWKEIIDVPLEVEVSN
ncbi:MAG: GTP-binding protein [Clostridia bacterium]